MQVSDASDVRPDFTGLADDPAAWKAPRTTMRTRQRLVRTLITEIMVDSTRPRERLCSSSTGRAANIPSCASVSPEPGNMDVAHTSRRLPSCAPWRADPRSGHRCAIEPYGHTGQGKTWTAHCVASVRRVRGIAWLPPCRKGWRMADNARCRRQARCQPSSSSQAYQGWHPQERADHARCATPNSRGRP